MSRFPKITETFVLYEMMAVERQGVAVEVYPLLHERTGVMHPEAAPFVQRAHFQPFLSWRILKANLYFLSREPRRYLSTLGALLRGTWGSGRYFFGALGIFPKTVLFALSMASSGVTHVHAHFASHPAAAAFVIQRLVGIPYSFTAHGSDLHRDRHMLREKVAEAAFVFPISNYNKEVILEECSGNHRQKVEVIHCGVDTEVFRQCQHQTLSASETGPFHILCIGSLHEVKGQTYLIEACRQLHERGFDCTCHIVGDGPDGNSLARQVRSAGLNDRVYFHGCKSRQEIIKLLSQASVFALPSVPTSDGRREGIPVALMEAMASGIPVVASSISGIPELVQDGRSGLLVPPRDARSLANALEQLHKDLTLRRRLGRAGRQKVLREFDLHSNVALLVQKFSSVQS